MSSDNIELLVDGKIYGGWKAVQVTAGIEQLAGTFDLTVSDRWPGASIQRAILPGMSCQVTLDDTLINTGWIDDVGPSLNVDTHGMTIRGRDKTCDLVDCSAIHKTGQWVNQTLTQIAADLLAPFGLPIAVETDVGKPFTSFCIQEGETVLQCLQRAAVMRAVLLITNEAGALVITRAGSGKIATELVEGRNMKTASAIFSWKERFSEVTVKGQSRGDDHNFADAAAGGIAVAKDTTINRYRPLIVHAEHHDGTSLADRATWEVNMRIGRSNRGQLEVQGWTHQDGPWRPNKLVPVYSPDINLDAEMLIPSFSYVIGERVGKITSMQIALPGAFDLLGGVGVSKLGRRLRERDKREKKVQGDDWSGL